VSAHPNVPEAERIFYQIGWNEDKSQCEQPCPDESGRSLPYFIREPKLTDKQFDDKVLRDEKKQRAKGLEFIPPVRNPYEHRQSCLAICTA